jgi:hypothetical protein
MEFNKWKENVNSKRKIQTRRDIKLQLQRTATQEARASEVQHNLESGYEVQGLVKPGSYLATVLNTAKKDIEELTKNDGVVVLEGTKDVGKYKTQKGLHQIKNSAENHNQTNIIVKGINYRYDLLINSCVNNEIKIFSRKLRKQLKVFDNASIIQVNLETQHFTRHGLHLNSKGKEQLTKKTMNTIIIIFKEKKVDPITMKWKSMRWSGRRTIFRWQIKIRVMKRKEIDTRKEKSPDDSQNRELQRNSVQGHSDDEPSFIPSK